MSSGLEAPKLAQPTINNDPDTITDRPKMRASDFFNILTTIPLGLDRKTSAVTRSTYARQGWPTG
jgi:hypothetical protein